MSLPVNPTKVLHLFAPLWLLLAISLPLYWERWQAAPLLFAFVAGLPIAAAIAASFMRERWRLELTPTALIHRTLGVTETFEWSRMGPIELRSAPFALSMFVRTFWFAFPTDAPTTVQEHGARLIGRRLLCVFGDLSPTETVDTLEQWRALHAGRAAAALLDTPST
jgi:hypothetical protein